MADWSPQKTWWMDLLKSALVFTLGAALSVSVLNNIEEKRIERRTYSQTLAQLRLIAFDDFRKSTLKYHEAALDAYVDLYEWNGPSKTGAMKRYEGEAYEDYLIALEEVRDRFQDIPGLAALLRSIEASNQARHNVYDGLVDDMLDHKVYSREFPTKQRPVFNKARDEFWRERSRVVREIGARILLEPD